MNIKEILAKIQRHPVVYSEMGMEMQLGIPYLEEENEKLFISFRPHREVIENNQILFYPALYEIEFIYPFKHITFFQNLLYKKEYFMIDYKKPICQVNADRFKGRGFYILNELYSACEKILSFYEKDNKISDIMLKNYQYQYWEAVERLHLKELYEERN